MILRVIREHRKHAAHWAIERLIELADARGSQDLVDILTDLGKIQRRIDSHTPNDLLEMKIRAEKVSDEHVKAQLIARLLDNAARLAPRLQSQPPPTLKEESTDSAPPTLTKRDGQVLRALCGFDPRLLVSIQQIHDAMDRRESLSQRSISPALKSLIKAGWAERPEGDRLGVRATNEGRRFAQKIAD